MTDRPTPVLRSPETCRLKHDDSFVVDSRPRGSYRWRLRECRVCGDRWPTFESLVNPDDIALRQHVS
jgi:transcriptional regulator NrdR family protein